MTRPWDTDLYFRKQIEDISKNTIVDHHKCFILSQLLNQALKFSGDLAEVGVYKGGTAKLILNVLKEKTNEKRLHLFDTFEGMPKTDPDKDMHKKGDFSDTTLEEVKEFVGNEAEYYKGIFPDTSKPIEDKKFCFVHVDCDIYSSVRACCEFFYERMEKGIILFDDYGAEGCPGAKEAVDEFFTNKIHVPIRGTTSQALVFKF